MKFRFDDVEGIIAEVTITIKEIAFGFDFYFQILRQSKIRLFWPVLLGKNPNEIWFAPQGQN
jgi:hypothetical protein